VIEFRANTMIFLETNRLLFRSHEAEDEADFVEMQIDPEVRRYVGGQGRGWSLEKAQHRFRNEYLGRPTETYGLWATILKKEGKYIGCCGLRPVHDGTGAHLGYYFAQPYWRRGFASEASKAFIDLAFTRLDLLRLVGDVEEGNVASEHILRKFGFTYLSREEIPGNGRIILTYELLRTEWERASHPELPNR
jgi:ribosomal-protein-alanine N-acetyltransferase